MKIAMKKNYRKIFVAIFFICFSISETNAYQNGEIFSAFIIDQQTIRLELTDEVLKTEISVILNGKTLELTGIKEQTEFVFLISTKEKLDVTKSYIVKVSDQEKRVHPHWKTIDQLYTYGGELGILFHKNETEFKLWAPLSSNVTLNLFKKGLNKKAYRTVELKRGDKGVWTTSLSGNLIGEFYSYSVTNFGSTKEVLDPYAKSLAITTRDNFFNPRGAIVNPSAISAELDFANIEGFKKREDAIIWEIHVRDFTVDPSIITKAKFGTYSAFSERLDYIKNLGITHIQLLPVLSSTYSDESIREQRMIDYEVETNYNWGYGPDSYFSVEGMYSEDPSNPELRINELKKLVKAIHNEGMGVTLDVVYNHTARLSFLEDIVPGYYHFMDAQGIPKESYGGGRPGTTHAMVRKLIIDSIIYWTNEYKVDGFRYDLMGDLDSETIQMVFDKAKKINPNILMVGECWRTYAGDDGEKVTPADQDWMDQTNSTACFSDEIRDELKSGHGIEGEPRFITGGARSIETIFNNVIAKPSNMTEDNPGDVLQYIAVHDGLTLHDMISLSLKKNPALHQEEIHKRIRLGNAMILTSQGVAFIHAGQEYGRTKQWLASTKPKREYIEVEGFDHPYFIKNSYDASDAVNMFDWDKVEQKGIYKETMEYTTGLIELRKSTDAFRLGEEKLISEKVTLIKSEDIKTEDLVIGYKSESTSGEQYFVFINADSKQRTISYNVDLTKGLVLVDSDEAGVNPVSEISGVNISKDKIKLDALTTVVIKL